MIFSLSMRKHFKRAHARNHFHRHTWMADSFVSIACFWRVLV